MSQKEEGGRSTFSRYLGDHGAAMPSMLHAVDFFMARSSSVVKLYNSLKLKSPCIPRHLRRRIRSFKPHHDRPSLPKHSNFPLGLSRRTRRRRSMYLLSDDRFLPTHVWHAKRFRIKNLWGMRLPTNVNNKGERAIRRLAQRACLVHDRSYMDCWKWEGTSAEILERLAQIGITGIIISHPKVVSGAFLGNGFISRDDLVVTPYQALWEDGVLRLWTHPAARPEVEDLFSALDYCKSVRSTRLELIGSRAKEVIRSVLGVSFDASTPGRILRVKNGIMINSRANGFFIDIILPEPSDARDLLRRLVFAGASAIGVLDRHQLFANFRAPDFPFDFPASRAGSRHSSAVAKNTLDTQTRMPPQCRMHTAKLESPFFPDWTLLALDRIPKISSLQQVWVQAVRGVVKVNAHIYDKDTLIGYATTGVDGSNSCGIASVSIESRADESRQISFRNPGSTESLTAVMRKCPQLSTDSSLLAMRM